MKRSILFFIALFLADVTHAQQLRFFEFGFRNPLPDSMNVFAATSDTAIISKALAQLALPEGERDLFINGEIQYGTQTNNPLYSWHFVTDAWELTELAVEVCDGRPDDVENDKQYWIDLLGYYCPWTSFVKREIFPANVDNPVSRQIRITPNPCTTVLHLDTEPTSGIRAVNILDALGKNIDVRYAHNTIDVSQLPSGSYYVVLRFDHDIQVYRIMKQ